MPGTELSQEEADTLIAMEKHRADSDWHGYPDPGKALVIPLISADGRESFFLDIRQGHIKLSKATYQNRARSIVVLLRLDIAGAPHRNPDNEEIPCPHLHIYRQGYGDKWAYPVSEERFPNLTDIYVTLYDFMKYCHITKVPFVNRGLQT